MNINLSDQLSGHVFAFMVVFTRLGAGFMMFPGIGETFVQPRIRMLFALMTSFLMLPVLLPLVPAMPHGIGDLIRMIAIEALVGLFFGSIMRLLMDIVETAGSIIAMETGLSNAMILNPALASQSALTSAFLSVAAIALLFVSGLDHFLIKALVGTYKIFPIGQILPFNDMAQSFLRTLAKSFSVGIQLASPFMVVGLLLYVAMGMMQRLMSQIQLFLIVLPAQIWGGFLILAITVVSIMTIWLQVFDDLAGQLFVRQVPFG